MKRTFLALWLALAATAVCAPPDSLAGDIDSALADLAKMTGLKPQRRVAWERIDRAQVRRYLEERVNESVKPEEIRAEEIALKKFGFAPPDFDLKKTMVDLLSEQAAAFYDYQKKKLFLVESPSGPMEQTALVHELAHALADQHFHLKKYIGRAAGNDDGSLARMAVMEGQATWLMSEYLTQRTGQSLRDSPLLLKLMSRASEMVGGQYPVFDRAPLYLRETLLFPYIQGMLFQNAVLEKLDKAGFAEVFRRPPASTQQILHPEKYFANVQPVHPRLPELAAPRAWRLFTDGEFGELDHAILIRQYIGQAESAELAPHWRGGAFRLLESKMDRRLALVYASEWATPEAAQQFFRLYQRVLRGKWKKFEIDSESAGAVAGRGDDGYFLLQRQGGRVSSLEGLKSQADAASAAPAAVASAANSR